VVLSYAQEQLYLYLHLINLKSADPVSVERRCFSAVTLLFHWLKCLKQFHSPWHLKNWLSG